MITDFAEVPAATELLIGAGLKALFGQSENQHAWEKVQKWWRMEVNWRKKIYLVPADAPRERR